MQQRGSLALPNVPFGGRYLVRAQKFSVPETHSRGAQSTTCPPATLERANAKNRFVLGAVMPVKVSLQGVGLLKE